jgi:hypothetical protein
LSHEINQFLRFFRDLGHQFLSLLLVFSLDDFAAIAVDGVQRRT